MKSALTSSAVSEEAFQIVAIGASAGGMEAVSELLANLPPITGMAFIYAQQHAPGSTKKVMELLSYSTEMPVQELTDLLTIEADRLYVIPFQKSRNKPYGEFQISGNTGNSGIVTVNDIFTLLASNYKSRVVGIILSGHSEDGNRGILDINKEGGLTFAQDDSAKFTHMPDSAIATGEVRYILSPRAMAQQLLKIRGTVVPWKQRSQGNTVDDNMNNPSNSAVALSGTALLNAEIKKSEARYRDLLFGLPLAVYTCNAEGYIELFNDAAASLWGNKPVIGKDLWCGSWKIYRQDGTPLALEDCPMALALKQKRPVSFEILIERPDGSRRHIIPNPQPTFDSDGNLTGAINTLIDITPQVESRKIIEAREKQFSMLANSIQNLAWIANADGWIFWYNDRWYEYTGTSPEQMEGWGWQSVHDPELLPFVLKEWQASIASGNPFEMTFPLKGADGKFREFLTRIFPIHDAQGKVIRWFGTNTDINEYKKHTESLAANLKESDERMQAILQYAPDAVITIDVDSKILSWNPEAEFIFGWKKEEVLGRTLTETIIPERYATYHTTGVDHYIKTGEGPVMNKPVEMSAVKKNGDEIPVELKISATLVNNKHIFIGFLRDISIRKKAEETIKSKTQQLIEAQQLAHIGSWEWDVQANKIQWSDELYRIYGLQPQELEPDYETYIKLIHPDHRDLVHSLVQQALKDHRPFKFMHKIICPDGSIKMVSSTGKVVTDTLGKIIRLAGTAQDVTEQQKYEAALKASEERFFKIFDSNPVPMSLAEVKTNKITYVNSLFCSVFGYAKEEIIGYTVEELELIAPQEYARVISYIFGHLEENRTLEEVKSLSVDETEELLIRLKKSDAMKDFEVRYTRKSGETFPAIISFEIIRLNRERYTVTSYHDITDRKKAEELLKNQNEQLEKMNKELQAFTYISSHDLQEPLRKIQTFAGRLMEMEFENLSDNGKDYFLRMQNAAERMQTLILDLLALSRANNLEGEFEITDLNALVEMVLVEFAETIEQENAVVDVQELGKANIIPFQFQQLIHNLLGNSLKFSKPGMPPHIIIAGELVKGSKVKIDTLLPHMNYCHLTFKDFGIGIKEEFSEKIFEVFQRLHGRDEYPGTGIGLAIVKKIVENHHGAIRVNSELEKGTTFDIYIPATD